MKRWTVVLEIVSGLALVAAVVYLIAGEAAFALALSAFSMACEGQATTRRLKLRVEKLERQEVSR